MTTTTRPLPQGVTTAPKCLWLCVSDDQSDCDREFPRDPSEVTWAADHCPVACGVRYVRADLHESPGYRAGYAAGLASAEGVIASLTARITALEGRPLGHVHVASQPATDCEPIWTAPLRPVEHYYEDEERVAALEGKAQVKAHDEAQVTAPPEPVVGVVYRMADAPGDGRRWKWLGEGQAVCAYGSGRWGVPSSDVGTEVAECIRSGELVPVTGKEGNQ